MLILGVHFQIPSSFTSYLSWWHIICGRLMTCDKYNKKIKECWSSISYALLTVKLLFFLLRMPNLFKGLQCNNHFTVLKLRVKSKVVSNIRKVMLSLFLQKISLTYFYIFIFQVFNSRVHCTSSFEYTSKTKSKESTI